jgi:hypothetical protein
MINLPINFEQQAQSAGNPANGGPPYQLSARDLMRNFVYSAIDIDDAYVENGPGFNGYTKRKITLPPPPQGEELYVLGWREGGFVWVETEACE